MKAGYLSYLYECCDRGFGPQHPWTFEMLGLEYRPERLGMRNRVERFFRYFKERTAILHH